MQPSTEEMGPTQPFRAYPTDPSGTTVDTQIPDPRCCTSEIVRVVPFADNQALTGGKDLDDGSYPHKLGPFLDAPFPARVNLVLEARPIPKHDRQVDALARM